MEGCEMFKKCCRSESSTVTEGCMTINNYNYYCCCCCGGTDPDYSGVIGVVDTGERSVDGARLLHCDYAGNILDALDTDYFNTVSPWKDMKEVTIDGDEFVVLPRFWVRRDTQPAGKEYEGNQRWLISPIEREGFECDGAVFKNSDGEWVDEVYIAKYRAQNNGQGIPLSLASGTRWSGLTWDNAISACSEKGDTYSLLNYQTWCSVLWLALVERATFQLYPEDVRRDPNICVYRGIEEFCYASTIEREWVEGLRINSSGYIEIYGQDGGRTYQATDEGFVAWDDANEAYIRALNSSAYLKNYFIANEVGEIDACLIPDITNRDMRGSTSAASTCTYTFFDPTPATHGAFTIFTHNAVNYAPMNCSFRFMKV